MLPIQRTACVGSHRNGPCRQSIEVTEPLPLCAGHFTATGLRTYTDWWKKPPEELASLIAVERHRIEYADKPWGQELVDYTAQCIIDEERQLAGMRTEEARAAARAKADDNHESDGVLYFVRSGKEVKIGKTTNLRARLAAIRGLTLIDTELLATEPGYTLRERALHSVFAAYRTHHEWFMLKGSLVAYINDLREAQGKQPIPTQRVRVDKVKSTL